MNSDCHDKAALAVAPQHAGGTQQAMSRHVLRQMNAIGANLKGKADIVGDDDGDTSGAA